MNFDTKKHSGNYKEKDDGVLLYMNDLIDT